MASGGSAGRCGYMRTYNHQSLIDTLHYVIGLESIIIAYFAVF